MRTTPQSCAGRGCPPCPKQSRGGRRHIRRPRGGVSRPPGGLRVRLPQAPLPGPKAPGNYPAERWPRAKEHTAHGPQPRAAGKAGPKDAPRTLQPGGPTTGSANARRGAENARTSMSLPFPLFCGSTTTLSGSGFAICLFFGQECEMPCLQLWESGWAMPCKELLLSHKRHAPQPAQPRHTNDWAP